VEIIVPGSYTPQEVKRAHLKSLEFRRNPYTTGSANLDNMIALNKAVILCGTHRKKFNARAARYELHPSKNLQRVRGNCDVCKQFDLGFLFICERDAADERFKVEKHRRNLEYAHFVRE
jgi:hypothetical protein